MIDALKESNGQWSSARIMFVIGLLWAMAMTTMLTLFNKQVSIPELIAFFSATSGVFIALKLGQKPMEK